jgi:hypothetical protein
MRIGLRCSFVQLVRMKGHRQSASGFCIVGTRASFARGLLNLSADDRQEIGGVDLRHRIGAGSVSDLDFRKSAYQQNAGNKPAHHES